MYPRSGKVLSICYSDNLYEIFIDEYFINAIRWCNLFINGNNDSFVVIVHLAVMSNPVFEMIFTTRTTKSQISVTVGKSVSLSFAPRQEDFCLDNILQSPLGVDVIALSNFCLWLCASPPTRQQIGDAIS